MNNPTKKQQREFWEWCGFKYEKVGQGHKPDFVEYYGWIYPDYYMPLQTLPPIDLNNLFKYAEKPLVDYFIQTTSTEEEYRQAYYGFFCKWLKDYIWNEPHNPALALFWALWQVKESK